MESKKTKYEEAKEHVDEIRGWYMHLLLYLVINLGYLLFNLGFLDGGKLSSHFPWWSSLTMPFFWGIGVLGHYTYVFKNNFFLGKLKRWEEKKIKEYIEREEEEAKKYNNL